MNDDFDDLDRALFALPLETPPAGFREAILRATLYADAVSPLAFGRWEIFGIGAALALAAWLVILSIADHAFATTFAAESGALVRALCTSTNLAWLAVGGSIAALATFANFTLPRRPLRSGRS